MIVQSNHNSPNRSISVISPLGVSHIAQNNPTAIARSIIVPVFLSSDGARFIVYLRGGISIPHARNAARKRSFDSFTALSGSQIISIVGSDLLLATSTVISLPCIQYGIIVLMCLMIRLHTTI